MSHDIAERAAELVERLHRDYDGNNEPGAWQLEQRLIQLVCVRCNASRTEVEETGVNECHGADRQLSAEEAEAMWKRGMSGVGF